MCSAKTWFVKTPIRVMKYESGVIKSNPKYLSVDKVGVFCISLDAEVFSQQFLFFLIIVLF